MTQEKNLGFGDRVRIAAGDSVVLGQVTWVAPGNLGSAATVAVDGRPDAVLTLCRDADGSPGWYVPHRPGGRDRPVTVTPISA